MSEETKTSREFLGSRLGFILLSAGCAIGLGNIWRFPYITGQYGGALFVCFYLLFLIMLGFPAMVMELAIGRASRQCLSRKCQAGSSPLTVVFYSKPKS